MRQSFFYRKYIVQKECRKPVYKNMCAFIDLNNPDVSLIYVTQVCNILSLFCCLNLFYRRKLNLVQSLGKKRFQNTSSYAIKIDIAFDPRAKIHLFICFTSFMKNCKCYIVTHDQICCIRSYQILQSDNTTFNHSIS